MKIRIVSWNVRVVNEKNKRVIIRAFIKAQKADLVCLQETKLQEMSDGMVQSLGGVWCTKWRALNARGTVSGIVVFWNSKVLHLVEVEEGSFSVSNRFRNCDDNLLWCFTGVYGALPQRRKGRSCGLS